MDSTSGFIELIIEYMGEFGLVIGFLIASYLSEFSS